MESSVTETFGSLGVVDSSITEPFGSLEALYYNISETFWSCDSNGKLSLRRLWALWKIKNICLLPLHFYFSKIYNNIGSILTLGVRESNISLVMEASSLIVKSLNIIYTVYWVKKILYYENPAVEIAFYAGLQ